MKVLLFRGKIQINKTFCDWNAPWHDDEENNNYEPKMVLLSLDGKEENPLLQM